MVSSKLLARSILNCLTSRGIDVEGLYLFGSHARREARRESDIDVLVVSPSFRRTGFWTRCARMGEARADLSDPVEFYPVTPEEFARPEPGGFIEAIRPELKPLYRRARRRRSAATAANGQSRRVRSRKSA